MKKITRRIFLLTLAVVLLSGCGPLSQLVFQPEIHFSGSYPYGGYEYGVYRLPQFAFFNSTLHTLRIFINGMVKAILAPGQRLNMTVQVWPNEYRQMSLVAQAFDGGKYIGTTRPIPLYPYMSVNNNRSEALVIEEHDIRLVGN